MSDRKLLIYKAKDFEELKALKYEECAAEFFSLTKYMGDISTIDDFLYMDIVDISAFSDFSNKQSLAEQIVPKFDDRVLFVCDDQKWQLMSYDLRYVFNDEVSYFKAEDEEVTVDPAHGEKGISRELFFYDKHDFYALEKRQNELGKNIRSVASLVNKTLKVSELVHGMEIIDLSALSDYAHPILIVDEHITHLNAGTIFICDTSERENLEYNLRFVFQKFHHLRDTEFVIHEDNENTTTVVTPLDSTRHTKITDLSKEDLEDFMKAFRTGLYGHPKFKDDFKDQVETFRVFNKLGENKILSLFLMGDSGVGKTEVARLIFECLKGKRQLAKINFGNYSNEFSLSSLIGSARGYIGSEDGEIFMKVRDSDVGILLIDEFEKSNTTLFNYFLDVLESGKMTSSQGQELDLNGFIIVFTSNISKEDYKKRISPELRSRFDYKCMFTLLGNEDKRKYVEFRAESIARKLNPEADQEFRNIIVSYLTSSIDVASYKNMRDINKQIKRAFVNYTRNLN